MRFLSAIVVLVGLLYLTTANAAYSQTNEYRDSKDGVSLSLPQNWRAIGPESRGDQKGIVVLRDLEMHLEARLFVQVLTTPVIISAEDMDERLLRSIKDRIRYRTKEGYENYHFRDNSSELHPINGHSALSWVSEYSDHGHQMVEYLTRVRSENTNALFFAKVPASQLDDFKRRLDPIIETLEIR